ncbi:MAG: hypothetical protein U0326_06995 [Polyangiales bacterium]
MKARMSDADADHNGVLTEAGHRGDRAPSREEHPEGPEGPGRPCSRPGSGAPVVVQEITAFVTSGDLTSRSP